MYNKYYIYVELFLELYSSCHTQDYANRNKSIYFKCK